MTQLIVTPDFNVLRKAIANEIVTVTGLTQNQVILSEPETQNEPRPVKPYFDFKFTTPAYKYGDDWKDNVIGTSIFNSGGPRKMTVSFHCYGNSHEEAYNYMSLWQAALDLDTIQQDLAQVGIAVWIIGAVSDLSTLLNTGFEGRAQMDVQFGIAMNTSADFGEMDSVEVRGEIDTGNGTVETDQTVTA